MISSNILESLNPQQAAAVTSDRRATLILAGAGSGKTRVLTSRIAWLVRSGEVSPHSILAVTFTNKAAREMLTRISTLLPINIRGMWVGTFHGLCNRLLRIHHREAGLPETFQILDSADQQALLKRILRGMNIDEEKSPAREIGWFINAEKEQGRRAGAGDVSDPMVERWSEVYLRYEQQCVREGLADFPELLLRCFELLTGNEDLLAHYRSRFSHILVDEFQDTSRLQYQWLKLLAGERSSLCVVGDDDQSIYGFRGASAQNMSDFQTEFGAHVIKLEQNYRSYGAILDAANALIRNNPHRLGKELWTSQGRGELLRHFEAADDSEEASYVVEEVKRLRDQGVELSQMALLYRSNAQSRVLEHTLFSSGLPYRVYGGLRFFERQEIKHALAYLRLVANPGDDAALLRVVNIPARGVGARTLELVQQAALDQGISLWEAARARPPSGKAGAGVAGFVSLIESLRAQAVGQGLAGIAEAVVERSGLKALYQAERDGADRVENLDELVNAAATFEADTHSLTEGDPEAPPRGVTLADFLAHAALEAGDNQAEAGAQALQLMTVHASKGLEFEAVFLCGLEEGLFPHENAVNQESGLEEERRLMYVALTRARHHLYLTSAEARMLHGRSRYNQPSRFMAEIPAELVERIAKRPPRWTSHTATPSWAGNARAAAASPAQSAGAPGSAWRIGQNVLHGKFGPGVIMDAEGRGLDARVQVKFRDVGVKWLALEYAKLIPA